MNSTVCASAPGILECTTPIFLPIFFTQVFVFLLKSSIKKPTDLLLLTPYSNKVDALGGNFHCATVENCASYLDHIDHWLLQMEKRFSTEQHLSNNIVLEEESK